MACSGLLHSPRVPRGSALLLAASKYHQALRVAHVRGCRDPQLPKGYAPGMPQEGARFPSQHPGIPGAKSASQKWVGSGSDRTNGGNGLRGGISLEPRCLQRARELFQILGLEALRSSMSCHLA